MELTNKGEDETADWRNTTLRLPDRLGHILRKELYPDTEILVGNQDTGRVGHTHITRKRH